MKRHRRKPFLPRWWPRWARGLGGEVGQSLVEFSLMTPILLLIIAGVVEAGRAFTAYVQLANAAREGARAGSFIPQDTATIDAMARREVPTWVSTQIISVAVSCAPAAGSNFNNCINVYPPSSGDKLKVQVFFAYEPIMPIINGITTFTALTMEASAVMRVQ